MDLKLHIKNNCTIEMKTILAEEIWQTDSKYSRCFGGNKCELNQWPTLFRIQISKNQNSFPSDTV